MADLSTVAHLRMLGQEEEARKLLDALNRIQTAFGYKPYAMPEPAQQFTGLITADASKTTPGEFLRSVLHPTVLPDRADLTPTELPNGRLQVAA